jgi:hypothetical protein
MTFPATFRIKNGPYTVPIRYRLQSDRFPGRCNKCHQPNVEADCLCPRAQEAANFQKQARANWAQSRQPQGQPRQPAAPSREQAQERVKKAREFQNKAAACKAQGICVQFVLGRCDKTDCTFGKHEQPMQQASAP